MRMKRTVCLFSLLCLLAACRQVPKATEPERPLTKLEQLYRIRPDSVIPFFDLSGDSLTEFPDLSRYVIRSLDLSHNQIDTFLAERLPLGIEKLDLSHNCFSGDLTIGLKRGKEGPFLHFVIPTLADLDFSHNSLRDLHIYSSSLRRLDVSYNDSLVDVYANHTILQYLDVSYDRNLGWLTLIPQMVDTVIQEGIDRELKGGIQLGTVDWKRNAWRLNVQARHLIEHCAGNRDSIRHAIRLLDESLRLWPSNRKTLDYKSHAQLLLGDKRAALETMLLVEQRNPMWSDFESYLIKKGILLELNGQRRQAADAYAKLARERKRRLCDERITMRGYMISNYAIALYLRDHRKCTVEATLEDAGCLSLVPDTLDKGRVARYLDTVYRLRREAALEKILWDEGLASYLEL